MKLMHNKYIVRDHAAIWTGSMNMTDDAFTLMENNIVEITSPAIAGYYMQTRAAWQNGHIENTGNVHTVPVTLQHPANLRPCG